MPEAEEWFPLIRQDYQIIKESLEATGLPYAVVPGNHDLAEIFFEVFPPTAPDITANGFRVISFFDHEHQGNVPRRFTPSRDLFMKVLGDENPSPQIHLQHYLLIPSARSNYPYHYLEHQFLREQIEASGKVKLCLSGHDHQGSDPINEGSTRYNVSPGFCNAPHRWRIYDLSKDEMRVEEFSQKMPQPPAPVVFLDRDGVINTLASYTTGPESMALIPGSAGAIRTLNERGIKTVVVTSQSAIGMGYVPEAVVRMVNDRMHALLAREGAHLDAVYYSSGAGEASIVPGMKDLPTKKSELVETAARELHLDLSTAWLVGDRLSDMEAARESGVRPLLVLTGDGQRASCKGEANDSPIAADLQAAVAHILNTPL
jgi:D-glycero-D-manno-heptose 1,7-bisphosphate phosphatase